MNGTGVIVIDAGKHPEHCKKAERVKDVIAKRCDGVIIDMSEEGALHEKYFRIRACNPTLIVTLDLAGFELLTENDTYSYNMIPCRMAHLLFGKLEEYQEILNGEFNFSMFFYARKEVCRQIREQFPEICNVNSYPAESDETVDGRILLEKTLRSFWEEGKIK